MGGQGPRDDGNSTGGLPEDAPNCRQAFHYFDANGNGEITAKEG
jgi:Ca2+-binding EF-hand superfamily protein